jgi:GxxExxY protein
MPPWRPLKKAFKYEIMKKPQINADQHELDELSFKINGCAMDVLNAIGHGFHEKIYENAMIVALEGKGLRVSQQKQYPIYFQEKNVGVFIPDLIIEDRIIVELKTIDHIGNHEKGQVLNYLRASQLKLALILNFKNSKLEWQRVIL